MVWRGDKNADWRIIKFQNNTSDWIKIDNSKNSELKKRNWIPLGQTLCTEWSIQIIVWEEDINNNYFKAVYRWNNDNKLNVPFISPKTGQIIDLNLKQQNNINNNNEVKVTVKNKDISENPIYQLEANYLNWLSITNLIVSNDKIENYLNYFSQWYRLLYSKAAWASMTKNLVEDRIKITFQKHEKLFNFNKIEISGIWGYVTYDITIFTEKNKLILIIYSYLIKIMENYH